MRLLAHKIQSPQEWEALQALTVSNRPEENITLQGVIVSCEDSHEAHLSQLLQVLEACMKNCGRRFHNEVGKFRFLNELIKVVSPKVS